MPKDISGSGGGLEPMGTVTDQRVIVGMPMYNEEETIGTVVTQALDYVKQVVCVDDGSSDSSALIAERCGARVIRHRVNRGYGGALKTIFSTALEDDVDILVVMDSDGQHRTSEIERLIEPIRNNEADLVIGSRFTEGGTGTDMPLYRKLGIKVINAANNLSSDLDIKDTQSGFRAFSKLAIEKLRFESEGMELSLEMLNDAHEKNLKITEVPVDIRYDVPKSSNFTAISHGLTVLLYAMMTLSHKKPLLVLGIPGVTLFATSAAMALNLVSGFTEQVDIFLGPGLTAIWIGVLGLAMIATGLVLQSARNFLRHILMREFTRN